jgi:hypothetical protein
VVAYADLGGLGTKEGPPARFVWTMPNLLPVLLPWLVVLTLLALPSNRNPRAWWIWAPLIGLALLAAGLGPVFEALDREDFTSVAQGVVTGSFGLAVGWLLGAALARRGRALGIVLMALAFAPVSLLALVVSEVWEGIWDLQHWVPLLLLWLLLIALGIGLVYAGALNLAGWLCRRRRGGLRVSLWLLCSLGAMWLVALGVFAGVMNLVSSESFPWVGVLTGSVVLGLVSFVLVLPFVILSFTCGFYRKRLGELLRLPDETAGPPAM